VKPLAIAAVISTLAVFRPRCTETARVAGTIARAAHAGRQRGALVDAGDVHAAVAAAAADTLRDAVGTLAEFERLAFFGRHRGVGIGRRPST
jgi:hypothetical protein